MLFLRTPASAHPVPFSYLDLRIQPTAIEGTLVVHVFDAGHELQFPDPDALLNADTAKQYAPALTAVLAPRLSVDADGHPLAPTWHDGVEPLPSSSSLRLHVTFPLTSPPGTLTVRANLFPYDPQHQTFLNIYEGDALTQAILDAGASDSSGASQDRSGASQDGSGASQDGSGASRDSSGAGAGHGRFDYFAGTRQGTFAVIAKFLPAGIHHILIGPDHLLFLIGLLLLGGTIRQLTVVVTSFTIAHSLTLSLAALNIVSPPSRIIEPAIALSIVFVGADNLLARLPSAGGGGSRDIRHWIAFGFGFIHGFGFASVLREMDLPRRALGWSLFSFNIGVEIGQLLVVILVASALAWLRARSDTAARHLVFVGSIVVIVAGACWFVQRVFFPGGL